MPRSPSSPWATGARPAGEAARGWGSTCMTTSATRSTSSGAPRRKNSNGGASEMNIICLDDAGCLYLSPKIEDWRYVEEHGITVVIDLEGDVDRDIPTMPNHVLYLYFPIYDEDLPDMPKLHGVARMAAALVAAK